jgi:hypothetical protein
MKEAANRGGLQTEKQAPMLPELEAIKSLFLHEWDPIGVSDCEGVEDEYDSYAMHVFAMLANSADTAAIGDYLNWVVTSRMSLRGNPERDREIAAKAVAIHAGRQTWPPPKSN